MGNFILHSVEALARSGNEVTVLVTRPWTPGFFGLLHSDWLRPPMDFDSFDPLFKIKVRHYLSIPRHYFQECAGPLYLLSIGATIRKLVHGHGIQIIHAHTELAGHAAIPIAREFGIASVLTLHGINTAPRLLNTEKKRQQLKTTLNTAGRVVLVGEPLRPYFSQLAGCDEHFRVVPNGFTLPDAVRPDGSIRFQGKMRIISVSNLHEGKGIDLAIRALKRLQLEGHTDWTYTVVGGGAEYEVLKSLVRELGLERQISFTGRLSNDQALLALNDADLFLLPSYREAFGIVYLEAMATGLLAIGVEAEGPSAFIRHGETGYLVPPRDIAAIQRLLQEIIADREGAAKIAAAGCEYVRQNYTWDKHAGKLIEVYTEVAGVGI